MKNTKKRNGMTLPELLIALGVIGVIAAIVLPWIFTSYLEEVSSAAAKKAYNTISVATQKLSDQDSLLFLASSSADENLLMDEYSNVLKFLITGTAQDIFKPTSYYKGTITGWPTSDTSPAATMIEGMYIGFSITSTMLCNGDGTSVCANVYFDTNGPEEPNMYGYDVLGFNIVRTRTDFDAVPMGSPNIIDASEGPCVSGTGRRKCTYLRVYDPDSLP